MSDRLKNIRIVDLEQIGGVIPEQTETRDIRKLITETKASLKEAQRILTEERANLVRLEGDPSLGPNHETILFQRRRMPGLESRVQQLQTILAQQEALVLTEPAAEVEKKAETAPSTPYAPSTPSAQSAPPAKKISKLQAIANKLKEVGYMAVYEHEFIKLLPFHDYEICNSTQVFGGCWKRSSRNRYTDIVRVFPEDDIQKMFTHFGFYKMGNVWVKSSNNSIPYVLKF